MASTPCTVRDDRTLEELRSISPSAGWYLTAVYWLECDTEGAVRMGTLADCLAVSPSSVTEMVTRLSDGHLISYRRYDGVELTERGDAVAECLARRQCTVTAYFDRVLSYSIDPYKAYRIGHVLPVKAIAHLDDAIDRPRTDACRHVYEGSEECLLESDARVRLRG